MSRNGANPCLSVRAPAKINLYLEVVGKRPDGYHDICTIMQTVSLYDELSFTAREDGQVVLRASGEELPTAQENLVYRAARLLQSRFAPARGVSISLNKAIPVGRGLGGGSSDAAATLNALNTLWGLGRTPEELQGMGAELGSDVPFFIRGGTALCEGRGERVTPCLIRGEFHYVLVLPAVHTSTAAVYAAWRHNLTTRDSGVTIEVVKEALATGDAQRLGRGLYNGLERAAFQVSPAVHGVGELLGAATRLVGSRRVCMSGSGSAFFAVCDTPNQARDVAAQLTEEMSIPTAAVRSLPAM